MKSSERTTLLNKNSRPRRRQPRKKKPRMKLPRKLKEQRETTRRSKQRKRKEKRLLLPFNLVKELDHSWIIFKFLIKNVEEMKLSLCPN